MDCPYCRTTNHEDYRYCSECGRPLPRAEASPSALPEESGSLPVSPGLPAAGFSQRRLAVAAIVSGSLAMAACAGGLYWMRTRRVKRTAPPAPQFTVAPPAPAAQATALPGPAQPPARLPGQVRMSGAARPPVPHPFVGPLLPAPRRPLRGPGEGALSPAGVRRVEPALAQGAQARPSGLPDPAPTRSETGERANQGGSARPASVVQGAPTAPGYIDIRVLGEGDGAAARKAPAEPPSLKVTVAPSLPVVPPLHEAQRQLAAARRAQAAGRFGEARAELEAASNLFRLVAERGGSEAAAARQGLEACRRALEAIR